MSHDLCWDWWMPFVMESMNDKIMHLVSLLLWKMVCDDELELEVTWFYLSPQQQFKTCVIKKISRIVLFPKPLRIEM